jgi:hypothetical protein
MNLARMSALLLLCVIAIQLASGCEISHHAEERDWTGVASDVRVQWTGEPGIEITDGVAVPVRAYLESYDLVEFTGSFDNAYPGFLDAVPPNEPTNGSDNIAAWDRRPTDKYPTGWNLVGNLRFHIRSVERTDHGAAVTLCEYRYALGQRKPDGTNISYISGGRPMDRGIFGVRLDLVAQSDELGTHLPPQRGPAFTPNIDVFGGWQIVGYLTTASAGTAEWPAKNQVASSCIADAPDPLGRREHLATGPLTAADFAAAPADPGWPE